jgi:hypothetical protein
MKIRSGPNVRIMTQVVSHYQHAVRQRTGDTGTLPAFGVSRAQREVNVINIPNTGRRSKFIKKHNVRRVTY